MVLNAEELHAGPLRRAARRGDDARGPRRPPPARARRGSGTARRATPRTRRAARSRSPTCRPRSPARSPPVARPAAPRPVRISATIASMSQCRPSARATGPFGKRWTSSSSMLPAPIAPDDHAPAGRAEVDGGERPRGHRRNAAATPASTGMCSPVVWLRSPPVRAKTAAATCSGRTSCLSSVRCA